MMQKLVKLNGKLPIMIMKNTLLLTSLNKKINSNKTKHLIIENELKKFQKFDSSYFRGEKNFGDDGTQSYLVFQPMNKYFKKIGDSDYISEWKSKGLSDRVIKLLAVSNNTIFPILNYFGTKTSVEFNGSF